MHFIFGLKVRNLNKIEIENSRNILKQSVGFQISNDGKTHIKTKEGFASP